MKKSIVILLALFLIFTAASETVTPAMFMASRGMMVLDQNQMEAMSGSPVADPGYRFCAFSAGSEDSAPAIAWKNETIYVAFDMTSMFGQGTMDANALTQVYIDFCQAFPNFDAYTYGDDIAYLKDETILEKLSEESAQIPAQICPTLDDFINCISDLRK